jgi:prevent-host-death family protein
MIQEATAMMVRQNLGELLNGVQYRHDTVLVTKAGKPVAALVDMDLFEKIRRMKEQFELLSAELGKAYAKVDEEIGMKEINNVLKAVRAERRAKH